jgi:hypothetical protein
MHAHPPGLGQGAQFDDILLLPELQGVIHADAAINHFATLKDVRGLCDQFRNYSALQAGLPRFGLAETPSLSFVPSNHCVYKQHAVFQTSGNGSMNESWLSQTDGKPEMRQPGLS